MAGAELIAIISVSGTAIVSIVTALFHGCSMSRCKKITCCCGECDRDVLSEEAYLQQTQQDARRDEVEARPVQ